MVVFGKKFQQLLERLGTSITGNEIVSIEGLAGTSYTASTISAAATDNSINDSANGLPIIPAGAAVDISGFVDASGEVNGEHVVASSTVSKLVVETNITADEAAGASVTVQERNKSYKISMAELQNYFSSAGLQDPITGSTFRDSRETVHTAASATIDFSNGNIQSRTLAGNETLEITAAPANGSVGLVEIVPGANTLSFGTSIDEWIGGAAPSTIGAKHWLGFWSVDGGTTVIGTDIGESS